MKETNWDDCLTNKSAKIITPDIQRAESLIETAKERINLIKEISEKNCNFVYSIPFFIDYQERLRFLDMDSRNQ